MFYTSKSVAAAAAAVAVALSGTALMAGSGEAHSGDTRCEIVKETSGGMVTLQGVVHAETPLSGSYMFRVESAGGGGGSNIRQGGSFTAAPGQPATLGRVMLGSRGTVFDATLDIDSDAGRFTCSERAGQI